MKEEILYYHIENVGYFRVRENKEGILRHKILTNKFANHFQDID